MPRLRVSVFILCFLLAVPIATFAQEANGPGAAVSPAPEDALPTVVRGLSAGDLLNIRASASPLGKTIGRLPNGAVVRKIECKVVDGYEWCRVDAVDAEELSGWTPARYLHSPEVEETQSAAAADVSGQTSEAPADGAAADEPASAAAEPSPDADGTESRSDVPIPQPAPRPAAPAGTDAESKEARLAAEEAPDALPPGLEARFAGGSAIPIDEVRAAEPRLLAPSVAEPVAQETQAEDTQESSVSGNADEGAAEQGVPVPTPRPGSREATEEVAETPAESDESAAVAQAVSEMPTAAVSPSFDATDEVPCARYLGQPMARCIMRVVRAGTDAANITVVWPDGGTRLIEFRDGAPAGSNSRGEFRFTREGTLNMIRIGLSERFEILDALVFED